MKPIETRVAEVRHLCEQALTEPEIQVVEDLLLRNKLSGIALVDETLALGRAPDALLTLARETESLGIAVVRPLERLLLIRAGMALLDHIQELPVEDSVRHLVCKEIGLAVVRPGEGSPRLELTTYRFVALCKIARGVRFPAGQHQWEISGFPRSWLARLPPRSIPRAMAFFLIQARGFHPYFETHLAPLAQGVPVLLEREFYMAFYRMAMSLERQSEVKAIMATSWMHSPETHRVSPHLAFMNRPFEEAGGLILETGPARVDDGFLDGNQHRANLYRAGLYLPTRAVALCSRRDAMAWAAAHPEYGKLAARVS